MFVTAVVKQLNLINGVTTILLSVLIVFGKLEP